MKAIEKIELVDKIARELQSRMTYNQIETFLMAIGINCKGYEPSSNSKRIYVEEILQYESDENILKIADELKIEYQALLVTKEEVTFWKQEHFRLFISHESKYKEKAINLQKALLRYGIFAFVAHEDIEASKEWQIEIEKALHTMDALTAILTEGFKDSEWCDQEVGFAVGKNVLILPIQNGIVPYGFIGKYQAINSKNRSVSEVAFSIFDSISKSSKSREKMVTILANLISNSSEVNVAIHRLKIFSSLDSLSTDILIAMSERINNNIILMESDVFFKELNSLLKHYNIQMPNKNDNNQDNLLTGEDEIPF